MNKGRAEDLFKRIEEQGIAAIDEFIAARKEEELFLDFKRSSDDGYGQKLSQNDRKNLSKAISGFGNSEGGIIVWGIDCSTDKDGADIAKTKCPIENVDRYNSLIQCAISGCTIPPHIGVRSIALKDKGILAGYVVTLIPKSQHAPHQSTSNNQYYIRAGSTFVPTPHAVLAGLFGKRPQPDVFLMYSVEPAHKTTDAYMSESIECQVGILVTNRGPGIARDVFIDIGGYSGPGPKCVLRVSLADRINWIASFAFGIKTSLICKDDFRMPPGFIAQPVIIWGKFQPPFENPMKVELKCGCDGAEQFVTSFECGPDQIRSCFDELLARPTAVNSEDLVARIFGIPDVMIKKF